MGFSGTEAAHELQLLGLVLDFALLQIDSHRVYLLNYNLLELLVQLLPSHKLLHFVEIHFQQNIVFPIIIPQV